jgi:hypothetical protein
MRVLIIEARQSFANVLPHKLPGRSGSGDVADATSLCCRVRPRLILRLFGEARRDPGRWPFTVLLRVREPKRRRRARAILSTMPRREVVVNAKRPLVGPEPVLPRRSHYTHRVAISNSHLLTLSGKCRFGASL